MKRILLLQFQVIDPSLVSHYFGGIYMAAFFIASAIFIATGLRKKIPAAPLLIIVTTTVILFILGARVFSFSVSDWQQLFENRTWPAHSRKTMVGGLAGLVAGLLLVSALIRRHRGLMDLAAFVIPAGMAVQRIGCLLSGCCFGQAATIPWGITYAAHSHAWESQGISGLIGPDAVASLPVHPTQVYDMIAWFLIIGVLALAGKRLKAPGSKLLATVMLYCAARFVIEFFRDPLAGFFPYFFLGFNYTQWAVIALLIAVGAVIAIREKWFSAGEPVPEKTPAYHWRPLVSAILLLLLFLVFKPIFDFSEKCVIGVLLTALVSITVASLFRVVSAPGFRIGSLLFIFGLFVFSGQMVIPTDPKEKVSYIELSVTGGTSTFYNTCKAAYGAHQDLNCDGDSYWDYESFGDPFPMKHKTTMGGIDIRKKVNLDKYKRIGFGIGLYAGEYTMRTPEDLKAGSDVVFSINPSFSFDIRSFGIKSGLIIGNFYMPGKETAISHEQVDYHGELKDFHIAPQVYVRVGPYNIAYVEFKMFEHSPQPDPLWTFGVGAGTGLGKVNGTRIAAGWLLPGVGYAEAYYPINDRVVFQGGVATNFRSGTNQRWSVSAGVSFRMNYQTKMKKVRE